MKLFAVGVRDSNPENWKAWEDVELYLAENKEQAVKMAGYYKDFLVAEVDMSKARFILRAAEYIE